jgi:hypothetical protein
MCEGMSEAARLFLLCLVEEIANEWLANTSIEMKASELNLRLSASPDAHAADSASPMAQGVELWFPVSMIRTALLENDL